MTTRTMGAKFTEPEIEWIRSHGGLGAVVRKAMSADVDGATKIRGVSDRSPALAGRNCRHPVTRRIGKMCGVCGLTVGA